MSTHKECGEEIRWVKRDDDDSRWMPPLEFAGHFYIITESGNAIWTSVYRRHNCDPDKIEAWQEYTAKIAALKESTPNLPSSAWAVARERRREDTNKIANTVKCPSCEAPVGHQCYNRTVLKKTGEIVETRNPHPARLTKAQEP